MVNYMMKTNSRSHLKFVPFRSSLSLLLSSHCQPPSSQYERVASSEHRPPNDQRSVYRTTRRSSPAQHSQSHLSCLSSLKPNHLAHHHNIRTSRRTAPFASSLAPTVLLEWFSLPKTWTSRFDLCDATIPSWVGGGWSLQRQTRPSSS